MRIQRIPLFLIGLMLTVSAAAQQKKDRGYWSLAFKKTFIESEKSNGNNTGIISGNDGEAQFRVLEWRPSYYSNGETYREIRKLHNVAAQWTKPPQYVKIGEEDKITINTNATIDNQPYNVELLTKNGGVITVVNNFVPTLEAHIDISVGVGVIPEVTAGNITVGFTMMQQVMDASDNSEEFGKYMMRAVEQAGGDMEAVMEALSNSEGAEWSDNMEDFASGRLANNEPWSQNLALGKESYMMVAVTAKLTINGIMNTNGSRERSYEVEQVYLYKYYGNGGDVDNTVRADDDDQWLGGGDNEEGGEDKGTELPPWVIPVAVGTGGAVVGYKFIKRRRKNDEEDPDEPEEEEEPKDDDKAKKPSTFKMILYKNFGSKLVVGDEPKIVGARIEERTAEGKIINRLDLTSQIEIEQGSNLRIVDTGMNEKYKVASITADEYPEKEPHEGDIWFIFRAPDGALKNRVVFQIEMSEILFGQDNLTLPSGYEKEVRLPFVAVGLDRSEEIVAKITPVDGNPDLADTYSV